MIQTYCCQSYLYEKQNIKLCVRIFCILCLISQFCILDDSSTIAVRWSAEESLTKDEFSVASDVWMMALFVYEIFTHGCWPYSELVGKETEDVMHIVSIFMRILNLCKNEWHPSLT